MPDAGDAVRQQLTEARRNQILEAAVEVFAARGFPRATTREIAAVAGVSEGTIYNYFESKADLLAALVTRIGRLEELYGNLAEALEGDPVRYFVQIIADRMASVAKDQRVFQVVLSELLVNDEMRQRFYDRLMRYGIAPVEQYLRTRIARGEFREVDVPMTVRAVQSMIIGSVVLRVLGDPDILSNWEGLPQAMANLVLHGLLAPGVELPAGHAPRNGDDATGD